jgi:5-methylcytosine-specific restriction protein A
MEEPVCRSCKGTPQPTRHTDHITPHRGDVGLFYDRGNLQALCGSCHSEKTKREMR